MLLNRVAGLASSVRIESPGFPVLRQPSPGHYGPGLTARQIAPPALRADRLEISPGARNLYRLLRTALGLKHPEQAARDLATLASTAATQRYDRQGRVGVRVTPPAVTPVAPASGDTGVAPDPDLAPASAPAPASVTAAVAAYDRQR